jgi:diaminohydroxyphosphoribosylaminopyrimidine deaminase/5-amino-6-(5-phosphoribosylamino)uracil reductase
MDVRFMKRALAVAARYEGRTSPNPPVGAVCVKDGRIIGVGAHEGPGTPHAEVRALTSSSAPVRGADLYVTLEPCSHHGRTPPCTDALIDAGIRRVFIGMRDPNPDVRGGGAGLLSDAGIEVAVGVMGRQIERFYEAYTKFVTTKLPFVTLKAAMTLDGRIATSTGDSKWISSEASRRFVHRMRAKSDAVMVGIGTVKKDDPQLTVRMVRGRDPRRVIIDPNIEMPPGARMLAEGTGTVIIGAAVDVDRKKAAAIEARGGRVIYVPREPDGKLSISALLIELAKRDVMRLLVEGGANIFTYFVTRAIFDKIILVYAPKILTGGDGLGLTVGRGPAKIADAVRVADLTIRRSGGDVIVEAYRHTETGGRRQGVESDRPNN